MIRKCFTKSSKLPNIRKGLYAMIDVVLLSIIIFLLIQAINFRQNTISLIDFHHSLSRTDLLLTLLPNIFFLLGGILLLIASAQPFFKTAVLRKLFISSYLCLIILIETFWSATFTIGGGQTIFSVYYLLTQLNLITTSFLTFNLVFILFIVGIPGYFVVSTALKAYKAKHFKIVLTCLLSVVFIGLSFMTWQPKFSHATSLNAITYLLSSYSQTPSRKDFLDVQFQAPARISISSDNKPNIVFIVLESTRQDALSFYNSSIGRKTDFFDKIAKESIVFSNTYILTPLTLKSLVSINCGITPYLNYPILESNYGIPSSCLPDALKKQGYQTIFMQTASANYGNIYSLTKRLGFDNFYSAEDFDSSSYQHLAFTGFDDRMLLEHHERLLESFKEPFVATYLTVGPHWPFTLYDKNNKFEYSIAFEETVPKQYQQAYNDYLNAVHYQDGFIEQLIEQYKNSDFADNSIFVFIGDHGSGFGEHLFSQRLNNLYQEIVKVPFIIYSPSGKLKHSIYDDIVNHVDIPVILTNILNDKEPLTHIKNSAVFSACWYWKQCISRTDKQYKFIHNFGHMPDELYDLIKDEKEKINIAPQHPDLTVKFKAETLKWYKNQLGIYKKFYGAINSRFYLSGHIEENTPY